MDISFFQTRRGLFSFVLSSFLGAAAAVDAGTSTLPVYSDGNTLDQDGDGVYDTVTLAPGSLSTRYFEGNLSEKGVMTFDLSTLQGRILTGVALDARVVGYTSSTSTVLVKAVGDDLVIDIADAIRPAEVVGQYYPVENGLNPVNISLYNAAVQRIVDAGDSLVLRIESDRHGTNTQLGSKSSSYPPKLIVDYVDFSSFYSVSDGRLLDSNGDGIYDSAEPSSGSLSIRTFSSLKEVSVSNFDMEAATGMVAQEAILHLRVVGIANNTNKVDIYGFNDDLHVDLEDATDNGVLLGSYDPTALGLGSHSVVLDAGSLTPLITDGGALSLRFSSDQNSANTQLSSLYSGSAPFLELDLVDAPDPLPPIADAGEDLSVKRYTAVTLDGSLSTSEASITDYQWRQVAGTPVSLMSVDASSVSFQAPKVKGRSLTLVFELTVSDSQGLSAKDQVTVTVTKK